MKISKLFIYAVILFLTVFIGSCSSSRENEAGPDAGTSQCRLTAEVPDLSGFDTAQGYRITISEGYILLKNAALIASDESGEEDHHDHSKDRHDEVSEAGQGPQWTGLYKLDFTKGAVDLGFANGDPGSYGTMSFYIHPAGEEHDHSLNDKSDEETYSVYFTGTAEKDGTVYAFTGQLPLETEVDVTGFTAELVYGRYTEMELCFHPEHWFEEIDFAAAETGSDGKILFSDTSNAEMAGLIGTAAATHIKAAVK